MRLLIGFVFFLVCLFLLKWWGLLSLIVIIPFIGWKDKHKGPLLIQSNGTTNYKKAGNLLTKYPRSGKKLQDILLDLDKKSISDNELTLSLNELITILNDEDYELNSSKKEKMIGFLNQFSDSFPSWQPEYKKIYDCIKQNLKD